MIEKFLYVFHNVLRVPGIDILFNANTKYISSGAKNGGLKSNEPIAFLISHSFRV